MHMGDHGLDETSITYANVWASIQNEMWGDMRKLADRFE